MLAKEEPPPPDTPPDLAKPPKAENNSEIGFIRRDEKQNRTRELEYGGI